MNWAVIPVGGPASSGKALSLTPVRARLLLGLCSPLGNIALAQAYHTGLLGSQDDSGPGGSVHSIPTEERIVFLKGESPAAMSSAHHRGQLVLYYTSSSPVLQLLYHAQRLTHAAEVGRSTEPLQALRTFGSHHSH